MMAIFIPVVVGVLALAIGVAIGWFLAWEEAEFRYIWNKSPFHNPRLKGRKDGK